MADNGTQAQGLDDRVRGLLAKGEAAQALDEALRAVGPDILGFLYRSLRSEADAEDVFAAVSERLWRSLGGAFKWQCPLRSWAHIIARNEANRFRRGERRHADGHVPISQLAEVIAAVTATTRSRHRADRELALAQLRDELSDDDRELLVLRVDRALPWNEIALAFADDPEHCSDEEIRRLSDALRQRFHSLKKRLAKRARAAGLLPK
jgi:RNA polymerase sigma factor (sigma-70 family)